MGPPEMVASSGGCVHPTVLAEYLVCLRYQGDLPEGSSAVNIQPFALVQKWWNDSLHQMHDTECRLPSALRDRSGLKSVAVKLECHQTVASLERDRDPDIDI